MITVRFLSDEFWSSPYEIQGVGSDLDDKGSQAVDIEFGKGDLASDFGSPPSPQVTPHPPPQVTLPVPQVVPPKPRVVLPAPRVALQAPRVVPPAPRLRPPPPQVVMPPPQVPRPRSNVGEKARRQPEVGEKVKRQQETTVSLGKMTRESARSSNLSAHLRDRRHERSVMRARECLIASKRRTSGLPPDFWAPARDTFRVPTSAPPPRHARGYRQSGSGMPARLAHHDHSIDTASSVKRSDILNSIKVIVVL